MVLNRAGKYTDWLTYYALARMESSRNPILFTSFSVPTEFFIAFFPRDITNVICVYKVGIK